MQDERGEQLIERDVSVTMRDARDIEIIGSLHVNLILIVNMSLIVLMDVYRTWSAKPRSILQFFLCLLYVSISMISML